MQYAVSPLLFAGAQRLIRALEKLLSRGDWLHARNGGDPDAYGDTDLQVIRAA
jgi:hypothetical protein